MDLTEAEDIKKRWKEYTELEVKWTLRSITTNKASGGDGIPAELFKIQKMMLLKCCTQYVSKFGNSGMATGLE